MLRNGFNASRKGLAVAFLLALTTAGAGLWQARGTAQDSSDGRRSAVPEHARQQADTLSQAFRKAAEVAVPTVVTIETHTKPQAVQMEGRGARRGQNPFHGENPFKGTPFEDFFNDDGGAFREFHFGPNGRSFQMPQKHGMGSGVIVDKSGIVLTNNHVVEGADEVLVRLSDGRQFEATDIKTDPATDLAVLRIKTDGSLPVAKLGDSDKMQIGDWVIAVGNPFGFDSTVSAGIISGMRRELEAGNPDKRTSYLQTDAAINPGNSGGPLLNLEGEVIGINTAIASNNGGYQGLGFAIPSTVAKWVLRQLIDNGVVQRGYLGVGISEVKGKLADKLGVEHHGGVVVGEVYPSSPAAEAGFEPKDVITSYAGKPIRSPRDLQELVERTPAGAKQQVEVLRDGKPVELHVVVRPLPKNLADRHSAKDRGGSNQHSGYKSDETGIEVAELTENNAEKLGFKDFQGVVITEVEQGSVAAEAGLHEGMLIMEVEKQPVHSVDEFKAVMKSASLKDGILLWVRTEGGNRYLVLEKK